MYLGVYDCKPTPVYTVIHSVSVCTMCIVYLPQRDQAYAKNTFPYSAHARCTKTIPRAYGMA